MADTVVEGIHFESGRLVELRVERGKIAHIAEKGEPSPAERDLYPLVSPGFIDLQVNGFAGYNLNDRDLSADAFRNLIDELARHGVTSCLPTVITADSGQIAHILQTIDQVCTQDPLIAGSVPGIHLEGPYLSAEPGFCGAHSAKDMKDPDWREFMAWQEASGGRIKMVTLAPERSGSIPFIRSLRREGIVAAMGHSRADSGQIAAAIEAGLEMCTHLGNGIHHMMHRHAPYVWDLLAHSGLYAGFIPDGHHLPLSFIKVLIKMKEEKAIIVSDATHFSGMAPGRYRIYTGEEVVLHQDRKLHLAKHPDIMAGSAVSMLDSVRNMLKWFPDRTADVLRMATKHPAQLLKLDRKGELQCGYDADLVFLKRAGDGGWNLAAVYRQGRRVA